MRSSKKVELRMILVLVTVAALTPALSSCSIISQLLGKGSGPGGSGGGSNGGSWNISGIVIEPDGTGVPAATVSTGTLSTLTDTSGDYTLSGLSDGSYTVTVSKSGFVFTPSTQTRTLSGADLGGVDFSATTGSTGTYSISGSVTLSGSGVVGASVSVGALTTATDSAGNFTLSGLSDGTYTVTASLGGYTFTPSSQSETVSGANIAGVAFTASSVNGLPTPGAPPAPSSYGQTESETPQTSTPVLVAAKPLAVEFSPRVTRAVVNNSPYYTTETLSTDPCLDQAFTELIDSSGNIVNGPIVWKPETAVPGFPGLYYPCGTSTNGTWTVKPLSNKPVLEVWEYWQLIDFVHYQNASTYKLTDSYTSGLSQTQAQSFTYTVGASFTASGDTPFGGVSATVSANVSSSASSSMTISTSTTTSKTFTVTIPSGKEGIETVWQLVYQMRLAQTPTQAQITAGQVDSLGYAPFTDPNFDFLGLPTVTIEQSGDVLPQLTLFTAP